MPYAETDEGRLYYTETRGREGGPVLILVHGAGGSRLHWPAELRRMDGARVYSLDLPGHGRSEGDGCETIDGYAGAVVEFMDEAGVDSGVIVGHSMGGAVGQTLALTDRRRVSCLVLVGTGARLRVAPAILKAVSDAFEKAIDLVTEYAWSSESESSLRELSREALRETGPEVLHRDFVACDRFDIMNRLGEIEAPTLVIVGSTDRLTPVKYGRFLSQEIPDAGLVTVDGAGHMVMLERPGVVVEAIRSFVTADCRFASDDGSGLSDR